MREKKHNELRSQEHRLILIYLSMEAYLRRPRFAHTSWCSYGLICPQSQAFTRTHPQTQTQTTARKRTHALQLGFIDALAAPLFSAAGRLLPGLAPLAAQLQANRRAAAETTDADMLSQVCGFKFRVPISARPVCFHCSRP